MKTPVMKTSSSVAIRRMRCKSRSFCSVSGSALERRKTSPVRRPGRGRRANSLLRAPPRHAGTVGRPRIGSCFVSETAPTDEKSAFAAAAQNDSMTFTVTTDRADRGSTAELTR